MTALRLILFIVGLIPLTAIGQKSLDIIVKTRILTDAIAQNPNFEIEKIISKKYSIAIDGIWKRRTWATTGQEWDWGRYYHSQGFTIGLIARYYFSKKNPLPNAWYMAGLYRYTTTLIKNLEQRATVSGAYIRTVNLYRKGPEVGILLGRQISINKWTTEINFGIGLYRQNYNEVLIVGKPFDFTNQINTGQIVVPHLYILWTIGYFFSSKMDSK